MKDDDNTYRITAALPFAAMKLLETGAYDVKMTMRVIFVFQFSGPKSLTIIEKLTKWKAYKGYPCSNCKISIK